MKRGFAAFGLACLLAGCAAGPPPAATPRPAAAQTTAASRPTVAPQPTPAPQKKVPVPAVPLDPDRIAARIQELESRLLKGGPADPDGLLAHELALLYIHPANRSPEPGKALVYLRTYLARAVAADEDLEAARLVALLEAIDRLGRLLRESRTRERELSGQVQTLQVREGEAKKREQDLQAEIRSLRERIEKLQALDLEMEKRRKSVR